ncbi:UNVERIFIED_CONTAM: hypothetical protein RMT77_000042 [Armadillidium vulgare]
MTAKFGGHSVQHLLSKSWTGWWRLGCVGFEQREGGGSRLAFCILLLILPPFCIAVIRPDSEQQRCVSMEAMEVKDLPKRYIIDNTQVTMPLTIADSQRISHRLTNAIFKKFLEEVVGYQEVKLVPHDDIMNPEITHPHLPGEQTPSTLVNVEVWIPPGFSDQEGYYMVDRGSQGTGGRFGWYVSKGKSINHRYIVDHWRSYKNEEVTSFFSLSKAELEEVVTKYTKDSKGNHFCPDTVCEEGMFIPEICKTRICSTLFAGSYDYSSFLINQINHQQLLVQVAWIGQNLTPQFVSQFRGDKSILFFSWWPSTITVLDNLLRVAFPSCTELNQENTNSYLCKYEMHALRKFAWKELMNYGKFAFDATERFSLHEEDYKTILLEYNHRTALNDTEFLLQPKREKGWDNEIIEDIACMWLNQTATSNTWKIKGWRPYNFNVKQVLWFAGIFPFSDSAGTYTSKTLVHAAKMAINDINKNTEMLNDYSLELISDNGGCSSDEVLYAFIKYVRTPSLNLNKLIGILGPSCSDTVEPLAGIAKLFNTVIISYSAEGAIISDQDKYPYFFRTIPENMQYRHVYLQLFKVLKWRRLASLTEDGNKYSEYLTLLQDNLQSENISIFNRKFPREARKDMATYLKFLKNEHYHIIIGDFYSGMACEIMCEANRLGMTAHQGFIWFLPRWFVPRWYAKCSNNKDIKIKCSVQEMLHALDGHLALGYAYYAPDDFVYHSGETVGEWKHRYELLQGSAPADYAGYTYDAVWTYAFALEKLLKERFTHAANMHSDTTTERFVQLIRQTDFRGVSGQISFPKGTSRKTIVDIMQFRSNATHENGTYLIVGNFYPDDNHKMGGTININSSAIEWLTPDGEQPGDGSPPESACVFETFRQLLGVNCEFAIIIAMVIAFFILLIVSIGSYLLYKIKYEKIEAPPWPNFLNLDEWEIPRERVIINRTIGAGAFGTVYGGECMISEDSGWAAVAVKTLKKGSTAENKLDFLGEAEMMKRFDHKNIVKLIGLSTRIEPIYMIMEFMLYGDLQTYLLARRHLVSERTNINDDDEVSSRRLTSMAYDVACALDYLASNKYVHRDVACRNCLVNADRVVKLSDFGMTRPVYENNYYRFNRKGMLPVRWMAPESIEDGIYTTMTDVWSYGVLLYEVITFGNFPFQGLSNNEVLEHVVKYGKTINIPVGIRPQLESILIKCWARVPDERPQFSDLIDLFSKYPRLITPCLEVPLASVQTNDSDSLEIGIDPTRRISVAKGILKSTPAPPPPPAPPALQFQEDEEIPSSSTRSRPSESEFNLSILSEPSSSHSRRNRAPMENGNGPSVEPLLPLTSGDSYITRYVCLQMNNKSPDAENPSSSEMTVI